MIRLIPFKTFIYNYFEKSKISPTNIFDEWKTIEYVIIFEIHRFDSAVDTKIQCKVLHSFV